jgi:hypothetical protein
VGKGATYAATNNLACPLGWIYDVPGLWSETGPVEQRALMLP